MHKSCGLPIKAYEAVRTSFRIFLTMESRVGWCLIFLICLSPANFQELSSNEKVSRDLHVLTLLPYFVPEFTLELQYPFDLGNAIYPAIEIAADIINNRTDLLQGYKIKLLQENSACNVKFRATEGLVRGLSLGKEDPPIVGIIGPACSISSTEVADFTGMEQIYLLSIYFAGTPVINNRKKYPFAYGCIDSSDVIAKAVVSLIRTQSWRNVSVFYAESRLYYSSLAKVLGEEIDSHNLQVESEKKITLTQRGVRDNQPNAIASVQNKNRIIVFMIDGMLLLKMLCVLDNLGLRFPNYMFILAGTFLVKPDSVEVVFRSKTYTCSSDRIKRILNTSVLIDYQLESTDEENDKNSGISLKMFRAMYGERIEKFNKENNGTDLHIVPDAALFFDSLWSLSLALNNSMDRVNLSTYSYFGQQENTKIIREELEKLDFEGLSGRVRYNSSTGRVRQNITISLLSGKELGFYTSSSNNITVVDKEDFDSHFISDEFEIRVLVIPNYILYTIVFLATISLVVIVSLHIATFVLRKQNSVKATSIKMSQLAYASSYTFVIVMLINIIIQGGFYEVIQSNTGCILYHILDILLSMSLTLLFGSTCLRTWRLYRIFIHYKNPGRFLSDSHLLVAMGFLVVLNLALTVPPVFISTYTMELIDDTPPDNTEPVLTKTATCQRKYYILWFLFNFLVTGILMVTLLFLTITTRKIAQKNFRTKMTIWMLYLLSLVLPVMISLYLLLGVRQTYNNIVLQFLFISLLMELLIILTVLLVFIPPLLPVLLKNTRFKQFQRASLRQVSRRSHVFSFSF